MAVCLRVIKENLVFYLDAINDKSYYNGTGVLDLTPLDNDVLRNFNAMKSRFGV